MWVSGVWVSGVCVCVSKLFVSKLCLSKCVGVGKKQKAREEEAEDADGSEPHTQPTQKMRGKKVHGLATVPVLFPLVD